MASSVIIDVPPSPSSSYQTAENEGEGRDSLEVETELSDLNQQCHGLGHEVSRLIFDTVENNEKLMFLKRRIEVFNNGENQLNREIEQLERKFLMMLEQGLNDDELRKFGEENGIKGCDGLKEKRLEPILDSEIGGKLVMILKISDLESKKPRNMKKVRVLQSWELMLISSK